MNVGQVVPPSIEKFVSYQSKPGRDHIVLTLRGTYNNRLDVGDKNTFILALKTGSHHIEDVSNSSLKRE